MSLYSPIYLVYVSAKTSDNPNPIHQSSKFKPPKKKKEKEKDTEPDKKKKTLNFLNIYGT